jgi:alpha-tubulin suppressor-like RCC1 family protein
MSQRKLTSARRSMPARLVIFVVGVAVLALWSVQPAVAASAGERMDAGAEHSCVVLDNGKVRCWGLNSAGQLGYGNTGVLGKNLIGDDETPDTEGPVDFGGPDAVEVAAGGHHSCAILDDGGVRCWGIGTDGQLGYNGVATIGDNETQANVAIGPNRTATAVTAGGGHTCAILDNGKVRCWARAAPVSSATPTPRRSATTRRRPAPGPSTSASAAPRRPSPPVWCTPAQSSTTMRSVAGAAARTAGSAMATRT